MSLNAISYSLPSDIEDAVRAETERWTGEDKISRVWSGDAAVWTGDDESKWLGWLDIVDAELNNVDTYRRFAADIEQAQFKDVLLMGMGGSSLCPEVLAITFGKKNFHILDSTVPSQVKAIEDKLDLAKTLFIVASKSGSTLEPNCFKQYFFDRVSQISDTPGKQFVAITDPGSKMEQIAKDDGFRQIFYGKPEIGGRFSALSAFGLTAAASMGLDVEILLQRSSEMVKACKVGDAVSNPGALLGVLLGICHQKGKDKLTIFTSPDVHDVGAWLEQLIAESTGKRDIAIIPVDREPVLSPGFSRQPPDGGTQNAYGDDRVFVHLGLKGAATDEATYGRLEEIERAGHPMIRIELESLYHLSQEFFRWEFATAVAGSIMKINPFNQPDVESAKIEAKKITEEYEQTGSLPDETPFYQEEGIALFSNESNALELGVLAGENPSLAAFLGGHISRLRAGDYFGLLAYIEMNPENEKVLQSIREIVLNKAHAATCLGFGPRFLHSTGQAYKGGGNNGVFLQITSDDEVDLPVPGQKYTFGVVKAAQARGDFQVLLDRGRRALRVHFHGNTADGLSKLHDLLSA
ncbi:MAG TPA: bifunctional transaldolase/phosoglucose isomerase [Pyrinomonadaceae bacterium]|nr:bifunctional transaldolase/phosoglucose isomerase [Pyrinomonadaceae bacterium]